MKKINKYFLITRKIPTYLKYYLSKKSEEGILPDGYTQLEYIQNNRIWQETRIETPFSFNQVTKIVANIEIILNSDNNSNVAFVSKAWGISSTPYICLNGTVNGNISVSNYKYLNNILTIDYTSTSSNPLIIGSWVTNTYAGKYNYKDVQFYNGENLVAHYIPARRNSDNAIGMYDIVTQAFFDNAGTGEFIAGGDV